LAANRGFKREVRSKLPEYSRKRLLLFRAYTKGVNTGETVGAGANPRRAFEQLRQEEFAIKGEGKDQLGRVMLQRESRTKSFKARKRRLRRASRASFKKSMSSTQADRT